MSGLIVRRTYHYDPGYTLRVNRWHWEAAGLQGYTLTRRAAIRQAKHQIRHLHKVRTSKETIAYSPVVVLGGVKK